MPKTSYSVQQQEEFLSAINAKFDKEILTKQEIVDFASSSKFPYPNFLFSDKSRKSSWGKYSVAMTVSNAMKMPPLPKMKSITKPTPVSTVSTVNSIGGDFVIEIPEKDPTYVPFGNYDDIKTIIESKIFFPVYITGLSGNGKTMSIIQACANLKREMIRVNITEETDELDLIGGTELVDGNTVNREGAVLLAMRRGAVLLIDEGDLNNTKILCLMPILEGKPYFNKKTSEVIYPAPGFNVFITGNTKGKGSDDGRFVGTKVMNEAFLERFSITMEQEYPSPTIEKKILIKNMEQLNCVDEEFATILCMWGEIIRKAYFNESVDEIISTRRLIHIVKTFAIFKDRRKAVNLAINRFDTFIKENFLNFYIACDASLNPVVENNPESVSEVSQETTAVSAVETTDLEVSQPVA